MQQAVIIVVGRTSGQLAETSYTRLAEDQWSQLLRNFCNFHNIGGAYDRTSYYQFSEAALLLTLGIPVLNTLKASSRLILILAPVIFPL